MVIITFITCHISLLNNIVNIAAGCNYSLVLSSNKELYAFGADNVYGSDKTSLGNVPVLL